MAGFPQNLVLAKVAEVLGFGLQNGTPTILNYTTPNDAKNHTLFLAGQITVTTLEVGGVVQTNIPGTVGSPAIYNAGKAVGIYTGSDNPGAFGPFLLGPNQLFSIVQGTALTGGVAVVSFQIFAN